MGLRLYKYPVLVLMILINAIGLSMLKLLIFLINLQKIKPSCMFVIQKFIQTYIIFKERVILRIVKLFFHNNLIYYLYLNDNS